MILPSPPDIAFKIFNFPIYWYGIIMALSIFISIITANKLYNVINPDLKHDTILEGAPIIIISGVLCARLYFCLLNPHHYLSNPLEILNIREGGLSVHGAIIGGIFSVIYLSRKYKVKFLNIMDSLSCATILGQAIGRWGNYFNSEAYGLPTASQKWGLYIAPDNRVSEYASYNLFHPAFLYESLLNLIAFCLLLFILNKFGRKYHGITFFSYLSVYSLIIFFIEQIRVDSALNIGTLPFAEFISLILFFVGIFGIIITCKRNKTVNM